MKKSIFWRLTLFVAVTNIATTAGDVWATATVPVTINYTTSTKITGTTLTVGATSNFLCPNSGAVAPCYASGDSGSCMGNGSSGNAWTTWSGDSSSNYFSLTGHASGSTIRLYVQDNGTGSTGDLAHLLCPNGTQVCHACFCAGNTQGTRTDTGDCSTATGTIVATSCSGTGQPVGITGSLSLTCP